ncbi:MAG: SpoIID/LytB domain-containing protein [Planctomycetes bacterium]|nr:SpoIID/LytB domain-containing protein [Planctomycetota bacterium]
MIRVVRTPVRRRRLERQDLRLVLLATAAAAAAAGCGPGVDGAGRHELQVPPLGPEVEVRIADVASAVLVAQGPVEAAGAGGAAASIVEGAPGGPGCEVPLEAEGDAVRIGALRLEGPVELRSPPLAGQAPPPLGLAWEGGPGPRRYRGSIVLAARGGRLRIANRLRLEEYLAGVVGSEMAASVTPLEALKAQAVAARTYALFALLLAGERGGRKSFSADPSFQVYGGAEAEHPRVLEAVRATAGDVLTYQGRLFRAYFHSTCGGATASAASVFGEPAIEPLEGAACGACEGARLSRWEARVPRGRLEEALRPWAAERGAALGALGALEVSERGSAGHALYVRVRHSGGAFEALAARLRAALDRAGVVRLPSTAFEVRPDGDDLLFEGRGWGHGVGLCQMGAARKGESLGHREILAAYFPGSALEKAY